MTTRVRVEFGYLGSAVVGATLVRRIVDSLEPIDVATTPTVSGSQPVVPDGGETSPLYAFVRALGGDLVVAWGADPTASLSGPSRKWVAAGEEHALLVRPGDRLSFRAVA